MGNIIKFKDANDAQVFPVTVTTAIYDEENNTLDSIITGVKNMVGRPLEAATAAAMTDTTKIYVYVGSETGYTYGHWYYYNGSAWADGGVYNSTAFVTDTTLAVSGMAADAKVTGDIKSEINHITDNLVSGGYTTVSNLYIDAGSKTFKTTSGVNLIVLPISGNTNYTIWKATSTVMRVATGTVSSPSAGNSFTKVEAHSSASNAQLDILSGGADTYMYIQLYANSDSASLKSIDVNIRSLIVYKDLAKKVEYINAGELDNNSIELTKLKGVTGVMQYLAGILHGKTVGLVSSKYVITNGNDDVYLFSKGLGWVGNPSAVKIIKVDKDSLVADSSYYPNTRIVNLATDITSSQYFAIPKTGLITLDFDYFADSKLPNTLKDTNIPKTLFGTTTWSSGINTYNGSNNAFAPFRYNGSITVTGYRAHTIYNDDGTVASSSSGSGTVSINVPNKVIVVYSTDITNAAIKLGDKEYEYSGKTCSVFGDSLTADYPYYPYLARLTGLTINNCGVGGSRISGSASDAMWQDARINVLTGDFIVIMGGTNDCDYATAGTASIDNYDISTFYGAYNVLLSKIYYRYKMSSGYYNSVDYSGVTQLTDATLPNIILIMPPPRFNSQTSYNNIKTFGGYVKQIAEWWNLPVIDAFANMQINWINKDYFFASGQNIHYNEYGQAKLGSLVASKMHELYADFDDQA